MIAFHVLPGSAHTAPGLPTLPKETTLRINPLTIKDPADRIAYLEQAACTENGWRQAMQCDPIAHAFIEIGRSIERLYQDDRVEMDWSTIHTNEKGEITP